MLLILICIFWVFFKKINHRAMFVTYPKSYKVFEDLIGLIARLLSPNLEIYTPYFTFISIPEKITNQRFVLFS